MLSDPMEQLISSDALTVLKFLKWYSRDFQNTSQARCIVRLYRTVQAATQVVTMISEGYFLFCRFAIAVFQS